MSVTWKCDRCARADSDDGLRISKIPAEWTTYYLAIVNDETTDIGRIETTIHLCFHCSKTPKPIEIAIN